MAEEQRPEQIEVVKSRRTGRELLRLDHDTGKVRVQDGSTRTWVDLRKLLDKKGER
jgi:hypothetical protein